MRSTSGTNTQAARASRTARAAKVKAFVAQTKASAEDGKSRSLRDDKPKVKGAAKKAAAKKAVRPATKKRVRLAPELELPPIAAPEVAPDPVARPVGRPSLLTAEMAESICTRIASGESLRSVCRDPAMPEMTTVLRWRLTNNEFSEQYAQAREIQAEAFYDELIEIADTVRIGTKTKDKDGVLEVTTGDMIEHRRLQVETRKFAMMKILPKRYGNKVDMELSGKDGGPVVFRLKRVDQE